MRAAIASETPLPGIMSVALAAAGPAPGLDARHGVHANHARTRHGLPVAGSNGGIEMLQARSAP